MNSSDKNKVIVLVSLIVSGLACLLFSQIQFKPASSNKLHTNKEVLLEKDPEKTEDQNALFQTLKEQIKQTETPLPSQIQSHIEAPVQPQDQHSVQSQKISNVPLSGISPNQHSPAAPAAGAADAKRIPSSSNSSSSGEASKNQISKPKKKNDHFLSALGGDVFGDESLGDSDDPEKEVVGLVRKMDALSKKEVSHE